MENMETELVVFAENGQGSIDFEALKVATSAEFASNVHQFVNQGYMYVKHDVATNYVNFYLKKQLYNDCEMYFTANYFPKTKLFHHNIFSISDLKKFGLEVVPAAIDLRPQELNFDVLDFEGAIQDVKGIIRDYDDELYKAHNECWSSFTIVCLQERIDKYTKIILYLERLKMGERYA